jgi:hypothetical protein
MDNTKEIAKTYQGLGSKYSALKTIHGKSIGTLARATLVSMQHGLIEVRIPFLLGSHMPRCDFPPPALSPPPSVLTYLPNSTLYPTVP